MGCGGSRDHSATEKWLESRRRERERQSEVVSSAPAIRSTAVNVRDAPREFARIFSRPPAVTAPPTETAMQRAQNQAGSAAAAPSGSSTPRMTIREAGQELERKFARAPAERIMQQGEIQLGPTAPMTVTATATSTSTGKEGPPAASTPQRISEASSKHPKVIVSASIPEKGPLVPADQEPVDDSAPGPPWTVRYPGKQGKENPAATSPQQPVMMTPSSHVPGCRCMICQPDAYDGTKLRKTWRNPCAPGCLCRPCLASSPVPSAHPRKGDAGGARVGGPWRH